MTVSPITRVRPRLVPVPAADPPYDDELADGAPPVDGTLALAFPSASPRPLRLRLVPDPADGLPDPPLLVVPDPRGWARRFAQAVVEVLGGSRLPAQLEPVTSREVLQRLERLSGRVVARVGPTPPPTPRVTTIRLCRVSDTVAEVSVVADMGPRRRALAMRLDARSGHWRCTALDLG